MHDCRAMVWCAERLIAADRLPGSLIVGRLSGGVARWRVICVPFQCCEGLFLPLPFYRFLLSSGIPLPRTPCPNLCRCSGRTGWSVSCLFAAPDRSLLLFFHARGLFAEHNSLLTIGCTVAPVGEYHGEPVLFRKWIDIVE